MQHTTPSDKAQLPKQKSTLYLLPNCKSVLKVPEELSQCTSCATRCTYPWRAFSPNQSPFPRVRRKTGSSLGESSRVTFTCWKAKTFRKLLINKYNLFVKRGIRYPADLSGKSSGNHVILQGPASFPRYLQPTTQENKQLFATKVPTSFAKMQYLCFFEGFNSKYVAGCTSTVIACMEPAAGTGSKYFLSDRHMAQASVRSVPRDVLRC